jgi:hypothetical protein
MGLLERQIALDYIYPKSGAPQGHLFLIFWGCKKLELLQIKPKFERFWAIELFFASFRGFNRMMVIATILPFMYISVDIMN